MWEWLMPLQHLMAYLINACFTCLQRPLRGGCSSSMTTSMSHAVETYLGIPSSCHNPVLLLKVYKTDEVLSTTEVPTNTKFHPNMIQVLSKQQKLNLKLEEVALHK